MKKLIFNLFKRVFLKKHRYPPGVLIHRRNGTVLFETEFNWYDNSLTPVIVVREVKSGKIFSITGDDIYEFKEFSGSDPNAGTAI